MVKPYAIICNIPAHLWMTTVSSEDVDERARKRHKLRLLGKRVWLDAKRQGAQSVNRFMLWVSVSGRKESPILAAETLKPIIDAGTDMGMWPDDDPYHRVCTCYLPDVSNAPSPSPQLTLWVIPLHTNEQPLRTIIEKVPGSQGTLVNLSIPDVEWLTSNMRESVSERQAKQTRIMQRAIPAWKNKAVGASAAVICQVRYPDSRRQYQGDPDNTAETATAIWGTGVALHLVPATPSLFGFTLLNDHQSQPKHHDISMLVFTTPPQFSWPQTLITTS
ncbi:hypothetical protein [Bombiscardovia coagulans]|uniref:Uncharacterized protein n=1 Tax=Bombiscardovia coagulans TaxID=686666 RepID=A0A261EVD5_9BIFI|nr:hypothetical protein [Bombiscardovia coagulans]OZG50840.1 hypothetical protein BOCO_0026 [Bombiscardovia coagulans]